MKPGHERICRPLGSAAFLSAGAGYVGTSVRQGGLVGETPAIEDLRPSDNFQGSLVRKLFTYNAINAVFAYTGYLKGHTLLRDTANDPELLELAQIAGREASQACV